MNFSDFSSPSSNATPLCFSIHSPPFQYSPSVASVYYSSIFSALGLTSNLVAFIVLFKSYRRTHSRPRSSFLLFLGALVVTDFLGLLVTGSIVVSFYVTEFNWRELDPDCHFCNFMGMSMVFYGLSPLLLGASMAVERFIGINLPFERSASSSRRRTLVMVLMAWLTAGGVALLPLVGVGSYHMQIPGSWCFLNIGSEGGDLVFSLIFSLLGLLCIAASFLLNTVSVVTLLRVCCGPDQSQRRRDYEVEMMVQLLLIMTIASVCWCPLLVFIAHTVLSGGPLQIRFLLLWIRFATWNQILDPWVYILFRRAVFKRLFPRFDWSKGSVMTLYPSFRETVRRYTRASLGSNLSADQIAQMAKLDSTVKTTTTTNP